MGREGKGKGEGGWGGGGGGGGGGAEEDGPRSKQASTRKLFFFFPGACVCSAVCMRVFFL